MDLKRICPDCGEPMDFIGPDVLRDDTGEHWLCGVVLEWECSHVIYCGGSLTEPWGYSWNEEYDDPETWRNHDEIVRKVLSTVTA